MGRGLAFLFGAGATLVLVTLALPHHANTDELGVAIPPLLAYVVVAVLLVAGRRLALWHLQVILAFGALLVGMCVAYGGDSADAYSLMFVWVTLYAGYYFRRSLILAYTVLCGAAYAGAMVTRADDLVPQVYWLMAIGTAGVAGALIGGLTQLIRAQAADLAAVTDVANGLADVSDFAGQTCELLRGSTRADAVALLEVGRNPRTTAVITGEAGSNEGMDILRGRPAREATRRALATGRPQAISYATRSRLRGQCAGHVQPVLRDGRPVGALALAYVRPRRALGERIRSAAALFAAETSVAMERRERLTKERERRAIELNDNVVQGLVVAKYALEMGLVEKGTEALDGALTRAREIMTQQLEDVVSDAGEITPGDLIRHEPGPASAPVDEGIGSGR